MKNATLVFAFTVAGACIDYTFRDPLALALTVLLIAAIPPMAAAFNGTDR